MLTVDTSSPPLTRSPVDDVERYTPEVTPKGGRSRGSSPERTNGADRLSLSTPGFFSTGEAGIGLHCCSMSCTSSASTYRAGTVKVSLLLAGKASHLG